MSFLTAAFKIATGLARGLSGKVKLTDVLLTTVAQLPAAIRSFTEFKGDDAEARINEALELFDASTGVEGITIFGDMPPLIEEQTLDALKLFAGNLAKNKAKVPGYYVVGADGASMDVAGARLAEVERQTAESELKPEASPSAEVARVSSATDNALSVEDAYRLQSDVRQNLGQGAFVQLADHIVTLERAVLALPIIARHEQAPK